jgi:hypothetical protein
MLIKIRVEALVIENVGLGHGKRLPTGIAGSNQQKVNVYPRLLLS